MTFIQKLLCVAGVTFASLGHAHGADVVIKRGYVGIAMVSCIANGCAHQIKAKQRTPLVMFHQTANTSLEFGKLIPEMGRDRTVIAIDTPGYGGSDGPKEVPTITDYMTAVNEGLKNLGYGTNKPVDVLGLHTGAFTGIELAIAEPKMVRKVVLVGVWLVSEETRLRAISRLPRYKTSVEFFDWFAANLPRLQKTQLAQNAGDTDWGLVIADSLRPLIKREYGHDAAFSYAAKLRERAPMVTQPVLLLALNDGIRQSTLDSQPLFKNPRWPIFRTSKKARSSPPRRSWA